LKTADGTRDSEEMPGSFVDAAQARRLFDSTSDSKGKNRLEKYQDEVRRIKDAIADSDWYAPDEDDEYDRPTGNVLGCH